jgi:hypothetical protein
LNLPPTIIGSAETTSTLHQPATISQQAGNPMFSSSSSGVDIEMSSLGSNPLFAQSLLASIPPIISTDSQAPTDASSPLPDTIRTKIRAISFAPQLKTDDKVLDQAPAPISRANTLYVAYFEFLQNLDHFQNLKR